MSIRRTSKTLGFSAAMATALLAGLSLHGGAASGTTSDGDVVLGYQPSLNCVPGEEPNCANNITSIWNTSTADNGTSDAFQAQAAKGNGVWAASWGGGHGVVANAFGAGAGLHAYSLQGFGIWALGQTATGGHIETDSQTGAGAEVVIDNTHNSRGALEVQTNGSGQGVRATSKSGAAVQGVSASGAGLLGVSTTGNAIKAQGPAAFTSTTKFARSGKLTIGAGATQVSKTAVALTPASLVLATIQGNVNGVWVQGVTLATGTSGTFTIHLNKPAPSSLTVGWFIVN